MEKLINGPRTGVEEDSETSGWSGLVDKWVSGGNGGSGRKLVCHGNEYVVDDDDEDIMALVSATDD